MTQNLGTCEKLIDTPGSKEEECRRHLHSATGYKRALQVEMRLLADTELRHQYQDRFKKLDGRLALLEKDCKRLQRKELLLDSDAAFVEASGLQDKTRASLSRITEHIAASKVVGLTTLEELGRQRKTVCRVDKHVDLVDGILERSEGLLKLFRRRMRSW